MNRTRVLKNIFFLSAAISILGLFGTDPLKFVLSVLFIPFLLFLFWHPGHPPVLLFGLLLQWLAITIKVIYGFLVGISFRDISSTNIAYNEMDNAFYLSIIGLFFYSIGLWLPLRKTNFTYFNDKLKTTIESYDATKCLYIYIIIYFTTAFIYAFRFFIPSINSFLTVFEQLKWGFFLFTFYIIHKQQKSKKLLYLMILFQFITGFAGFFSFFKEVLIFCIIGYIFIQGRINYKIVLWLIPVFFLLLRFGILWTAIKGDYRTYLSGGEKAQIVTVSTVDALLKASELMLKVNNEMVKDATIDMINRVGYIDYFSLTLDRVPSIIPYENGKIWKDAIKHVLLPRIINPNKAPIDDSEHTSYYTGINFTGGGQASFSLGYTADAYIDFGPYLMFVPIFLLGLITGLMYKNLFLKSRNIVWGLIFVGPMYYLVNIYGMDTIKVMGLLFAYFLVIFISRKYLSFFLNKFMLK
jgi:hypothetical protein